METTTEFKVADNKNKTGHALLAFAGCVCMVSGLISLVCGNPVSGCAMMCVGLTDVAVALYYLNAGNKNA